MRTNLDFAPYRRSTIGFDHLFDLLEGATRAEASAYPPFDIERHGEDGYSITIAAAGFRRDEIELVAQNNLLTVSGRKSDDQDGSRYLHRGIVAASFERQFQLADFVVVEGASFEDGLLRISLRREVPEALKPRRIEIAGADPRAANDRLEGPAADHEAA